jgi:hypothetical protein
MDEQAKTLVGGDFRIEILEENGFFEYELWGPKEKLIICGGDFETYDELIEELSEFHQGLKAIFG